MRIKQPAEVYGELQVGKISYPEFLEWCDAYREMNHKDGYLTGLSEGFLKGLNAEKKPAQ